MGRVLALYAADARSGCDPQTQPKKKKNQPEEMVIQEPNGLSFLIILFKGLEWFQGLLPSA